MPGLYVHKGQAMISDPMSMLQASGCLPDGWRTDDNLHEEEHMAQQIFTVIFLVWMFAALILWWLMWRNTTTHNRRMTQTLIDVAQKSADAALKAAEAAYRLAEKG